MTEQLRTLHKAGIVDVNAIAAFLQSTSIDIDFDGDGEPDHFVTEEIAAPAFRLFLSHVVLEHGELWYVDDTTGIQAIALWLPSQPDQFAAEFDAVLARELREPESDEEGRIRPDPAVQAAQQATQAAMTLIDSFAPELILVDIVLARDPDRGDDATIELIHEVTRPVLASPTRSRFAAVSLNSRIVAELARLGFAQTGLVPFGPDVTAWVGTVDYGVHRV